MNRFLKEFAFNFFAVLMALQAISAMLLFFLGKGTFYKPQFLHNHFKNVSLDYYLIGSSTGLTTLNTSLIDRELNVNGINASMDDTDLSVHLLMIKEFLQYNPPPKKLILCINPWDINKNETEISTNAYRFLTYSNSPHVRAYLKDKDRTSLGILKNANWMPFAAIMYFNKEIIFPALFSIINPTYRNRFDEKGNYSYPNNKESAHMDTLQNKYSYDINSKYYHQIIELCNKNKMDLIVYQSPIAAESVLNKQLPGVLRYINHSDFIYSPNFFYDGIHVNALGREACTLDFIDKVRDLF
jgi:hypothetical protein